MKKINFPKTRKMEYHGKALPAMVQSDRHFIYLISVDTGVG